MNICKCVPMSLAQLVKTMHNICKIWGLNPEHKKKKKNLQM